MSKKGWGIGAIVVAAGLIVSPTIIGSQTESSLREHVELFDQEQPGYTLEVVSYERNWFSSQVVVELGIDLPKLLADPEAEVLTTDIELSIQHGPILTDQGFSVGLASWQAENSGKGLETYVQWDESQPFYLQQGSVSLLGNAVYQDYIPRLQSTDAIPEFDFTLTEYRGDGSYSSGSFAYQGNYEQLLFNVAEEFAVELNAMAMNVDAQADLKTMIVGKYYPSTATFTIGQMRVESADEELFLLSHLVSDITLKESEDGRLAHIHMGYRAEQVFVGGTEATELRLLTAVNNIDRGFVDDYFETMKDFVGEEDPQVLEQQMTAMMERHKEALLMAQPEFAIGDFGFRMPEGELDGSMRVALAELEQVPAQLDEQFIQQNMVASARVAIDKPLAERLAKTYVLSMLEASGQTELDPAQLEQMATQQATMVLQNFVQQGLLKIENEQYLLDAEVAQGLLNLNGQSLPLGQMM
ncbi:YdgA family protein [Pseudidiomarina homiensis]|uniref:DUF945 domain-containing protein n=1 Tax=Pseudidiomarina homiensis TaxID=364198 RepID=A0A432XUG0_9GAMM|nr:YdgA family protein [Pseudidiomarina homiensis]RUO52362.1 hypothetical protein CWI70_11590 [Pseudidiomarina homiensis]